jgi:hypothetical protein
VGVFYSDEIASLAYDLDDDPLTFSKIFGPAWLVVAADGTISGTPGQTDIGQNNWTVRVADDKGAFEDADMRLTVVDVGGNNPPTFNTDPISEIDATEDTAYSSTLADDASDPDSDPLTFSKVSGPAWLTVAANGDLSGTPGAGDVGGNSWTVQVADGVDGSDQATLNITVDPAGAGSPDVAGSDFLTAAGTISGSVTDTQTQNDGYESITETDSGGKPSKRHDLVDHIWDFALTGGNNIFNVDAYYTDGGDSDSGFTFQYSASSSGPWTNMLTVTKTSDNDAYQTYDMGAVSGTIYVRVVDTDQSQGEKSHDTIYVDHIYVDGGGGGEPDNDPPTPDPMTWSILPYATGDTSIAMSAAAATDPSGVEYYFACTAGGGNDSDWQGSTTYEDTGLTPSSTYTYTTKARDLSSNQNETATSTAESATTNAGCTASTAHVDSIVSSVVSCGGSNKNGQVTVTVYDDCGNPVAGADVDGTFTRDYTETILNVTTDANGEAVFTTAGCVKKPKYDFCVDDITHATLTYASGDNTATCDSY